LLVSLNSPGGWPLEFSQKTYAFPPLRISRSPSPFLQSMEGHSFSPFFIRGGQFFFLTHPPSFLSAEIYLLYLLSPFLRRKTPSLPQTELSFLGWEIEAPSLPFLSPAKGEGIRPVFPLLSYSFPYGKHWRACLFFFPFFRNRENNFAILVPFFPRLLTPSWGGAKYVSFFPLLVKIVLAPPPPLKAVFPFF